MKRLLQLCVLALLLMVQGVFMPAAHAQLVFRPSPKSPGTPGTLTFHPATPSAAPSGQANGSLTASLTAQLQAAKSQLAASQSQLGTVSASLSASQAALATASATLATTQASLTQVQAQLAAETLLAASASALQAQVNTLTASNQSLMASNATLTSQVNSLTASVASLTSQKNSLLAQVSTLSGQVSSLTATNSSLNSANASLTSTNNTLTSQNGVLTAANQSLTTANQSLTASNAALSAQVSTLNGTVAALNGQVSTLSASVDSLTSQVSTLTASVSSLTSQNGVLAGQNSDLTTANNALTQTNNDLASQNGALQISNNDLTAQVGSLTAQVGPARRVYAHSIPVNVNYYDPSTFGEDYPLAIGGNNAQIYGQVGALGLDGLWVDIGVTASGMASWLGAGDNYGFTVAPCIDTNFILGSPTNAQIVSAVQTCITQYVALATTGKAGGPFASAQKGSDGKLVVNTYSLSSNICSQVKAGLLGQSPPVDVHFVLDIGGTYFADSPATSNQTALDLINLADECYTFGLSPGAAPITALQQGGKPFAWTSQPGYLRPPGDPNANWRDAQGTVMDDYNWQAIFANSFYLFPQLCRTAFLSTYDDLREETERIPSSNWSFTRTELTASYIADFCSRPAPTTDPRLYITVPQCVYDGNQYTVELLVINPAQKRLAVVGYVTNSSGTRVETIISGTAGPGRTRIRASFPNDAALRSAAAVNGTAAVHVYANLNYDPSGTNILGFPGPQTALYDTPLSSPQTEYYSIASSHSRSTLPTGSINIKADGTLQVTMTPSGSGTVKALDLLHDTRLSYSTLSNSSYSGGPVINQTFTEFNRPYDNRADSTDHGCWIIRQINTDLSISYSNPIAITHNG